MTGTNGPCLLSVAVANRLVFGVEAAFEADDGSLLRRAPMSADEDLMSYLDDQFARVHAKLDRILSEMIADFSPEYEAPPPGGSRRAQPLARDRGGVGTAPGATSKPAHGCLGMTTNHTHIRAVGMAKRGHEPDGE